MHTRMRFFSRGSHGRGNQGRGNWNRGPRRPRFSIHLDADSQELGQLFQTGFLTRLEKEWSNQGLKGLPSKPYRSLVSQCPLMSHCNLKSSKMMDGKILSTRQSPNIVADLTCLYMLSHLLIKLSKFPLVHSPIQSSHANKRLKIEAHHAPDKGKATAAPSSPSNDSHKSMSSRMHLRDDCSHVVSEIGPKGSTHPKTNSERLKCDSHNKEKIASQSGKYGF
jgi:hypothetical protein